MDLPAELGTKSLVTADLGLVGVGEQGGAERMPLRAVQFMEGQGTCLRGGTNQVSNREFL